MSGYYDRQGNPLSAEQVGKLLANRQYKRIGLTVEDGYRVSTVWLGLNHQFGDGPPLIFETMIFGPDSWADEYCERYATEDAARAGHDRAVAILRTEILPAVTP